MNMKVFLFFVVVTIFTAIPSLSYSQHKDSPKIGVVLSGGGAKGIAHVGILKALEEEGIRPDFIVGTSMGSLIGGLYSIGYSADQLDSIVRQIDWDLVLSSNIPYNYISFEEKEYYTRFLLSLYYKDGKLTLPSGMIEGQMLSQILSRYTWPAMQYSTFDDFTIPFRCVATDVSTGKPIIFKEGSLGEAMRASMAIPTVFTAADLDSTLAVDGGVLDNFPVDQALKMGADIIIGVNVSDEGLTNAHELGSMTGILMQVAMFPSLKKVNSDIAKCDIYIKPDLKSYSTGSFSYYSEILELGYEAGEKARPQFRKLAKEINREYTPPSVASLDVDSILISNIELRGNKLVGDKLIYGKLGLSEEENTTREDIEDGVNRIYGVNAFKKVQYRIVKDKDTGKYTLTVDVVEKQPASINASVHYDNLFSVGILINTTLRNLLGKSSRFIAEGDISANPKIRLSYIKYLGKRQRIAGFTKYSYLNEQIPEYEKGQLTNIGQPTYHVISSGLIVTQSLKHSALFGLKYRAGIEKLKFWNGLQDGVKNLKKNQFLADVSYSFNTFDDRNYPTSGTELGIIANLYFNNKYYISLQNPDDTISFDTPKGPISITESLLNDLVVAPLTPKSYGRFQFKYEEFFKVKPAFQIVPTLSFGLTISNIADGLFDNYRVGGNQMVHFDDTPFYGLNFSEIEDVNYMEGGLSFQNVFFGNIFLKYGANFMVHHSYVPMTNLDRINIQHENILFGYGMKITYKSFLGPVSFGLSSNANDNYLRWYIGIGYSFNYKD